MFSLQLCAIALIDKTTTTAKRPATITSRVRVLTEQELADQADQLRLEDAVKSPYQWIYGLS